MCSGKYLQYINALDNMRSTTTMYVARQAVSHSRTVSCTHPSLSGQGCYLCGVDNASGGAIKDNLHLTRYSCRRYQRDMQETMQDFNQEHLVS